jgi:predicted Zn finger-like uncharacterized protein
VAQEKEILVQLPLRNDGLLERECPHCHTGFAIDDSAYTAGAFLNLRCPNCEWIAASDEFVTPQQHAHVLAIASNELNEMAEQMVNDGIRDLFAGLRGGGIRVNSDATAARLGRRDVPAPNANKPLILMTCATCGFGYAHDSLPNPACPVCRGTR